MRSAWFINHKDLIDALGRISIGLIGMLILAALYVLSNQETEREREQTRQILEALGYEAKYKRAKALTLLAAQSEALAALTLDVKRIAELSAENATTLRLVSDMLRPPGNAPLRPAPAHEPRQ